MSTSHGPPSRGRLALALTAAAAAAAPAAAPAAPVAKAGTRSDIAPAPEHGRSAAAPTRPAPVATPTARSSGVSEGSKARSGPVIVEYAVRPVTYRAPAAAAPEAAESGVDDPLASYASGAPVAEVELLKLTRDGGASRLAVVADEPGLLRVSWTAGSARGSVKQQLRAGRHDLRLSTPRGATHVRVHATLHPSSGGESAATHAAFRLRT